VATNKLTTTAHSSHAQTGQWEQADAAILGARVIDVAALAGIALLTVLLFWTRVRLDPTFFNGDIVSYYLPFYTVLGEHLRAGQAPGWNPAMFSGVSLVGSPQSGWGYLPVMLLFVFLKPLTAYQGLIFGHLLLAGVATYLFARKIGMGPAGAATAAIAYETGPLWYFAKIDTVRFLLSPWIPLGLLAVEMAVDSRRWSSRVLWWGLTGVVISQMITGYLGKGMYYGLLTIGVYLAYRTVLSPGRTASVRQRLAGLAISGPAMLALGFGLTAYALLPRLDLISRTNLAGGNYEAVAPEAVNAPSWTVPVALFNILNVTGLKYYIGGATFALAIAGLVLARRRYHALFFALFSLGVLTLTLGPTPFQSLMYLLPKFKVIHEHVPSRILVIFNIGPAMLAGAAISTLERRLVRPAMIAVAAIVVAGGYFVVASYATVGKRALSTDVRTEALVVAALFGVAAAIWADAPMMREQLTTALRALTVVALMAALTWFSLGAPMKQAREGLFSSPPLPPIPLVYTDDQDATGAGAFLRSQQHGAPFRYFGYDNAYLKDEGNRVNYHSFEDDLHTAALLVNNRAMTLHLQDIQGYDPVQTMRYVDYMNALNGRTQEYHEANILPSGFGSPLLPLLNAKYVVLPADPGPQFQAPPNLGKEVFRDDQVRVVEFPNAFPRAWIVHDARQLATDAILPALASGSVDPHSTVLLEQRPPALQQPAAATNEQISILNYDSDRIRIEATAHAAGMVVLSEMYDPNWQAFIDGKRVPIYQADYILRAVPIDAGTHTIELRYAPSSLTTGTAITITTLVALVTAIAILWWYERHPRGSAFLFTIRSHTRRGGDQHRPSTPQTPGRS
jgi:hypothetical protein